VGLVNIAGAKIELEKDTAQDIKEI